MRKLLRPAWPCLLWATLLLAFWSGPAAATVLSDWDLAEVLQRADRVVVGVVVEQRTLLPHETGAETLMTASTVRVEQTLKGRAEPHLVLSQMGGTHGTLSTEVVGDARLRMGDRVLLATYDHPDGRTYLVGMSLGAYGVAKGVDLARASLVQHIEVPLVDRKRGTMRSPPGDRVENLEHVRALLAQQAKVKTPGGVAP